ncbi:MAG: protein kinase, partial [Planctomycetes bacterium]|nr:protein kinase [Planctomycetota bacterium]
MDQIDAHALSELLASKGINITSQQLEEAVKELADKQSDERNFAQVLVDKGLISLDQVTDELQNLEEDFKTLFDTKQRYELLDKLGQGGMGIVYKAFDRSLNRYVALKFLDKVSDEGLKRFKTEAENISKLTHPNIVPIYEVGSIDGKYYIAMRYIEGKTLSKLIGILTLKEYVQIIKEVCKAIEYAHSQGIIHRDLKPQNIIIDEKQNVFVMDFGLAKHLNTDQLTITGEILGTPGFMSPEQVKGEEADFRSDIFTLGASLYNCITGVLPFSGNNSSEVILRVLDSEVIPPRKLNNKVHRDLEIIVQKCLSKDKKLRFQTVTELREDLERFLQGEPIKARPLSPFYIIRKKVIKYKSHIIIGLLVMGLTLPFVIPLINKTHGQEQVSLKMKNVTDFIKQRRYDDAISELEQVLKIKPDYALAHTKLADIFLEIKKQDKALFHIEEALRLNKSSIDYYTLGQIHLDLGNYVKSESAAREAIKLDPKCADAYSLLGYSLLQQNKLQEAEENTQKAVSLKNDSANIYVNLSNIHIAQNRLKDAEDDLKKAISIAPN